MLEQSRRIEQSSCSHGLQRRVLNIMLQIHVSLSLLLEYGANVNFNSELGIGLQYGQRSSVSVRVMEEMLRVMKVISQRACRSSCTKGMIGNSRLVGGLRRGRSRGRMSVSRLGGRRFELGTS